MKKNQEGIDSLKTGLTLISSILKSVLSGDGNDDGKIDAGERIKLVGDILPQLFPVFNLYANIKLEIEDKVTDAEFEELVEHTQSLDFLPDGKEDAEEYVKSVLLWINYNRRFVRKSIKFFEKGKEAEEEADTINLS